MSECSFIEKLDKKDENGQTLYLYHELGWVPEERLHQEDVVMTEKWRAFMMNPENSHCYSECPGNRGFSSWGGNLPCGQQNCWVDCHCRTE